MPKNETQDGLSKAINECPTQIWRKDYTINGEVKKGIGSVFFMAGDQEQVGEGNVYSQRPLNYYPWYMTGPNRPASPLRVDKIVKRELKLADGNKKERMATCPIFYKDTPNSPVFKKYQKFIAYILSTGYMTEDALKSLGSRATRSKAKASGLTNDQQSSLRQFMRKADVQAEIRQVQDESADRAVLSR